MYEIVAVSNQLHMLLWQTALPEDVNVIEHRCLHDLKMLAEGGFGIIYQGEHEDWGTVAYKELKTSSIKPESRLVHNQWQIQGKPDPHGTFFQLSLFVQRNQCLKSKFCSF